MSEGDKSALVVLVPAAETFVGELRQRFDISAICGLPAHVTILIPLMPPDSFPSTAVGTLRMLFAEQPRFQFSLAGVCGFPSVIYLVPEPLHAFDALTRAAGAQFPEYRPYGGAFEHPVPHLTVAQHPPADDLAAVSDQVLARAARFLPIRCLANEVSLVFKRDGRWSVEERFALS